MIPGPTIIRKCSACGKHISQDTNISGNTCGARFWTDGKWDAPMLLDQPPLVKCQHCGTLVWIDEQTEVGELDAWHFFDTDDRDRFRDARPGSTPTLQDYADLLDAGISDKNKEHYVRLRAWWAGNDPRRESGESTHLDSFEKQNLGAFLALLDETDDHERVMKAEVFRELGEFNEAEKLLATDFDDELTQAVSMIRDLNQKRIATVAEMESEEPNEQG